MLTLPENYARIQRHWCHDDDYACAYIKVLVSGLPREIRERINFIVLSIYFDDSGVHGPPVYLLAGYRTKAEAWCDVVDKWQEILHRPPKLDYFKMEEAWHRHEQFEGWSIPDRDERVLEFARLVDESDLTPIKTVIPIADFEEIVKANRGPFKSECNFALLALLTGLFEEMSRRLVVDWEEFEIFFDEGCVRPGHLERAYQLTLKLLRQTNYADLAEMLPGRPTFRNDKKYLALQAADLYAWHVRRESFEQARGAALQSEAWEILQRKTPLDFSYDRSQLLDFVARGPGLWPKKLPKQPKKSKIRS